MNKKTFDTVVVGAGIIGLGIALEELKRNKKVLILGDGISKYPASWASLGLLITRDAKVFHSKFREFYVKSVGYYPDWIKSIIRYSEKNVELAYPGAYLLYDDENAFQKMKSQLEREEAEEFVFSPESIPQLPFLKQNEMQRYFFPNEGFVHTWELVEALKAAIQRQGGIILPDELLAYSESSNGVELKTNKEKIEAGHIIVASGAWSGKVLEKLGYIVKSVPVKGQVMEIENTWGVENIIHLNEHFILVPRGEKSLIVGATTEAHIWEEEFDEIGQTYFKEHFTRYFKEPSFNIINSWSGVRPRTQDRKPHMGFLSNRLAVCFGHYKNGISMAPLAAICMSELINRETPGFDLDEFDPWRKKGVKQNV